MKVFIENQDNSKPKWYEQGPFIFLDTETTGLSPVYHRIVEIAAIRVDIDNTRKEFYSLINPRCKIPYVAQRIHGISDDKVKNAPAFHEISYEFLKFIEGATLVAHNARFDLAFLQESLNRCGMPLFKGKTLDTLTFFKAAYPELKSHKLQNIRNHLQIGSIHDIAHSALGDVRILLEAFICTYEKIVNATE